MVWFKPMGCLYAGYGGKSPEEIKAIFKDVEIKKL